MNGWPLLSAITNLRKTAADVVTLCDLIIYGGAGEGRAALPKLAARLRLLAARAWRVQDALRRGGGGQR